MEKFKLESQKVQEGREWTGKPDLMPALSPDEINSGERAVFPVSFAQEGLWFIEQMAPGNAAYNMPEAWRLKGILNERALQRSVEQIIRRHETLRTVFGSSDGKPAQIVLGECAFRLGAQDLRGLTDREERLKKLLAEEARRPFDLKNGPLMRIGLIRMEEDEEVLFLTMHHIISDAWSVGVFLRELAELYGVVASDSSPNRIGNADNCLAELPIQYADFAAWQREQCDKGGLQGSLAYWKKKLEGPLPSLALPTDHPRPTEQSFRGATLFFEWPADLGKGLKNFSRRNGVTLFMTLLTGFNALLQRYTRQGEIIVGSPMAGRDRSEVEGLIGLFVNTLALRTDVSGDPSFLELLKRLREVTLGAYEHQDAPLEKLMEALQLERVLGSHPLFQTVLGLQADFAEGWTLPGLTASRIELDSGTAKFDWTLLFTDTEEGLRLRFEYNTDLFEAETIVRFEQQFRLLLEGVMAAPEKRLSEFRLMTVEDRQELVETWNQTTTDYERDQCVHEVFEAQAEKSPEAVALAFKDEKMTYAELNRRANQLARRLQQLGVGPESLVGLCVERSPEMIVAMLAILKAGGAYVPLDRTYPKERLDFMLEDSGARVVVEGRGSRVEGTLTPDPSPIGWERRTGARVVCLNAEKQELARESGENLTIGGRAERLAYVIYTSGSTGVPKGTAIPHRGVVRLVRKTNYAIFSPEDVFLQLAPISFDASTFEIWGALLNGAKLVIFPPHAPTFEELGRTIQESKVTTLWLTAGLFHQMVDHQLESLQGVRQLLAGGEALSVPHVVKAARELKGCQIINGYGPTENTTFTCCYCVPESWSGGMSVSIGKPISNTRVYILDENGEPTPIGVPGELCIGGDGLARGYVNRPELTAERFVPNSLRAIPEMTDSRLYRSGDLARWLGDGNIEFLGRMDEQLKIRGFRVEPGEIEAALMKYPVVRQAVVTARADKSGTKQLVAYWVGKAGAKVGSAELREFLEAKLPPYMVPSFIMQVEEFALTANGKVDRRRLPSPESPAAPGVEGPIAPRNQTEALLLEIWKELLGREGLGVGDNFFHLGGHSLLATQMISRIARLMGVEIPVRAVFEAPTVTALARVVMGAEDNRQGLPAIPRRRRTSTAAELLERLDELSDSEVEELLNHEWTGIDTNRRIEPALSSTTKEARKTY